MSTSAPEPRPELEEGVTELERMNDHLDSILEVLGQPETIAEAAMHAAWWTAIATLLLVGGALLTFWVAVNTLRQMKLDSHAQTRPYVYAKLDPSVGGPTWDLVIANTGRSTARNVRLSLSNWPDAGDRVVDDVRKMFDVPHALPPNTRIRILWNLNPTRKKDEEGSEGFIEPTTLRAEYTDDQSKETYLDEYPLNADLLGLTPQGWQGTTPSSGLNTTEKKLSEMVRSINQLRL